MFYRFLTMNKVVYIPNVHLAMNGSLTRHYPIQRAARTTNEWLTKVTTLRVSVYACRFTIARVRLRHYNVGRELVNHGAL